MSKNRLITAVAVLILLGASLAAVRSGDVYFQIRKQLAIFSDIYTELLTLYVDEMPAGSLMKTGVDAMLQSLDPYTTFINEGEEQQMEILSSGNYGGIGLDAGFRDNRIVVVAPFDGYPAERAGIRPGDIILAIDGISTEGMNPDEIRQLTMGDIGSRVTMDIERRGVDHLLHFELERERVVVRNISWAGRIGEREQTGYVQLVRFGQRTSEELREHLTVFRESGGISGLILDLRNNPGGLLNEAVEVVDRFIGPGERVVETKGRLREHSNTYFTDEPPVFEDLPVVVLLNGGSASAAEVVAGALQDLDRAVILGESSFGKGLVQMIRPLSYNTSLKITVSRYYTPSGRSIQSMIHGSASGSAGREIPGSLRREYKTRNGRTIQDGTGIEPDVVVYDNTLSLPETLIKQQNLYFFFINDYIADLEASGAKAAGSGIPENLFDEFVRYLQQQEFTFSTPADRQLESLRNAREQFSDRELADGLIGELDRLLQEQKALSLEESREAIRNSLQLEWIARVNGEAERLKAALGKDSQVSAALEILDDRNVYDRILKP